MIMGMSFARGVFFHDRNVLACAEVKNGEIHVWAEKMTLKTIFKLWTRITFTLPWYYHVFHLLILAWLLSAEYGLIDSYIDPLWVIVYFAGFHFVFPRQLKKFHGAEHKVFSYAGEKKLEAIDQISQANIVNSGCSTNFVTCFFIGFLAVFPFAPLLWSVIAGASALLIGFLAEKYVRKYGKFVYTISEFLQRHFTTKEPNRIHLETAIRSYRLFEHYRTHKSG